MKVGLNLKSPNPVAALIAFVQRFNILWGREVGWLLWFQEEYASLLNWSKGSILGARLVGVRLGCSRVWLLWHIIFMCSRKYFLFWKFFRWDQYGTLCATFIFYPISSLEISKKVNSWLLLDCTFGNFVITVCFGNDMDLSKEACIIEAHRAVIQQLSNF